MKNVNKQVRFDAWIKVGRYAGSQVCKQVCDQVSQQQRQVERQYNQVKTSTRQRLKSYEER